MTMLPYVFFFLSGFCGLLYQVVWMRLAFIHFGVITPVLSVVVSVFMLGLAVGSFAAGRWITDLTTATRVSAVSVYALIEFFIGVGGLAVPHVFALGEMWLLGGGEIHSTSYLVWSGVIITVALLPWCVLMGATFPVMMAFLKEREASNVSGFSALYTANVLGAMAGVLVTAGVLIELLGLQHTLHVAAGCNGVIALGAVALGLRHPLSTTQATMRRSGDTPTPAPQRVGAAPRGVLGVLFLTGLISMALEVVWTRAFTPVLTTTIYAFALIVAVYLLATWLGSVLYRVHLSRRRLLPLDRVLAGAAVSGFAPIFANDQRLQWPWLCVLGSIAPLCLLLGYLTPQLVDRYSQGRPAEAGRAYGINTIGCILGPLVASYGLLPVLGTKDIMALLTVPLFVVLTRWVRPATVRTLSIIWGSAVVLIGYSLGAAYLYDGPFPHLPAWVTIRRDHTATVVSDAKEKTLFVNGIAMTSLTPVTKMMAHLPLGCLKQPPRSALVICFGMGTTYRSLLSWRIKTTAVELVPSVTAVFGNYFADAERIVRDPLGMIVIDDGRRFLKRTEETFDVITIDPPPPIEAAASSLLYSTEFYALIKQRLRPGGILQQWFPGGEDTVLVAVAHSLRRTFPHVAVFRSIEGWGYHFLASMEPLRIPTPERFIARLPDGAQQDLLEWQAQRDLGAVVARLLAEPVALEAFDTEEERLAITDDRPYNEYYLLRRLRATLTHTYRTVQ